MSRRKPSELVQWEKRIAAGERDGVVYRWRYGRVLVRAKAGRRRLPKGYIGDRIREAERAGLKLTGREIQYRMALAEAYPTETHTRTAVRLAGSWTALREAGFPAVPEDELGDLDLLDELDEIEAAAPDAWEQLTMIPGLGPTIKVGGRAIALDDATIADVRAYRDMYRQMNENFAKRLALLDASLAAMEAASGGDDTANAAEAYRRGTS